ncbi:MAG: hypothetical protein ACE5KI_04950 [Dehalococcoidia bacterium]
MARAFAVLAPLVVLVIIVQGILFAGGIYEEPDLNDAHRWVGEVSLVAVVVLIPLGFLARFPRRLWIEPLTVLMAVLWIVQIELGFLIEDERWVSMLHIPNSFLIFALALILTARVHRAMRGKF